MNLIERLSAASERKMEGLSHRVWVEEMPQEGRIEFMNWADALPKSHPAYCQYPVGIVREIYAAGYLAALKARGL